MKPVEHLMWDAQGGESPVTVRTSLNNWQTTSPCQVIQGWLPNPSGASIDVGTKVLGYGLAGLPSIDDAFSDHWQEKKPSLSTRLNLTVFLYELTDLKRMFDVLPSRHLSYVTHTKGRRAGKRLKGLHSWRDVLMYINSGHLNYNFGWRPFVSDLKKIADNMMSWKKRLRDFVRRSDQDLRLRRTPEATVISDTSETPAPDVNFTLIVSKSLKVQFSSTFEIAYSIPDMGETELMWRAIADIAGLNLSPETIWQVIPWSFVCDWFWDVGGLLKTQSNDWVQPYVEYHQGCVTRHTTGSVSVGFRDPYGGATHSGVTVRFSHFLRKVGMPDFSGTTDPLDADKIRLGASLLLSLSK